MLPFELQKLPPECLDLLRYLAKAGASSTAQMESGSGLSSRLIGKSIRRLINADLIELRGMEYKLSRDGEKAAVIIEQVDNSGTLAQDNAPQHAVRKVKRHFSLVVPRNFQAGSPTELVVLVNPPSSGEMIAPTDCEVVLRLSAVGGTLSRDTLGILIPPMEPAAPHNITITPSANTPGVRVRVDAFQQLDMDKIEKLDGVYFDVRVLSSPTAQDLALRAVGLDVELLF